MMHECRGRIEEKLLRENASFSDALEHLRVNDLMTLCMTSSPLIYTALNVPTATSYPSINCLQWSADGQACFVTRAGAYIMVGSQK